MQNIFQVVLQPHEIDLEELYLPGLELREVESESCGADDGGGFRDDEERGRYLFEGVVDAVDSLALPPTSKESIT